MTSGILLPECEQYSCSPRCIINSTKSYQGVATGEKTWFCSMSFSTFYWIDDFLRNSLALIQGQYKRTPVGAKGTVCAAEDDAIFTFSAMGRSKTLKAHKLKTPCLNNLLYIFSFNYWNWVYNLFCIYLIDNLCRRFSIFIWIFITTLLLWFSFIIFIKSSFCCADNYMLIISLIICIIS